MKSAIIYSFFRRKQYLGQKADSLAETKAIYDTIKNYVYSLNVVFDLKMRFSRLTEIPERLNFFRTIIIVEDLNRYGFDELIDIIMHNLDKYIGPGNRIETVYAFKVDEYEQTTEIKNDVKFTKEGWPYPLSDRGLVITWMELDDD